MKKYSLIPLIERNEITKKHLYRICAITEFEAPLFGTIKVGTCGGVVENENQLSQEGSCWIGLDVILRGNVSVTDNAVIKGNVIITANTESSIVIKDDIQIHLNHPSFITTQAGHYESTISNNSYIRANKIQLNGNFTICGDTIIEGDRWNISCQPDEEIIMKDRCKLGYGGTLTGNINIFTDVSSSPLFLFKHAYIEDYRDLLVLKTGIPDSFLYIYKSHKLLKNRLGYCSGKFNSTENTLLPSITYEISPKMNETPHNITHLQGEINYALNFLNKLKTVVDGLIQD